MFLKLNHLIHPFGKIFIMSITISLTSIASAQVTAERFTPAEIYIPGMAFEIAIMVTGDPGFITVVETPPEGWKISGITNSGVVSEGMITWELPSFAGTVKLSYKVTPPQSAKEDGMFSGTVGDTEIEGVTVLYYEVKSGIAESEVEKVASFSGSTEGPVWHKDGFLLFCTGGVIKRWAPGEKVSTWQSIGANGLAYDSEGRLVACVPWGDRKVLRVEHDGNITVISDNYLGKKFNIPNDLCIRSDGMIFFTDWKFPGTNSEMPTGVYCVKPSMQPTQIADNLVNPNGIALSPDEKKIYIADSEFTMPNDAKANFNGVRVYDVAEDGRLSNGKKFAPTACDGLKLDQEGNVYISIGPVVVYSPEGELIEVIRVPEMTLNIAFGDADYKTLYMTAGTGVYKVRVRHAGVSPWRSHCDFAEFYH